MGLFRQRAQQSRMVAFYADRFRQHVQPDEEIFDAGSAYNVAWAMEHGDSMNNGLLVIGKSRIFHCLDYGQITWESSLAKVFGTSTSKHPMPQTVNLHVTYLGESGVHSQMTFYMHPLFAKSTVRLLK